MSIADAPALATAVASCANCHTDVAHRSHGRYGVRPCDNAVWGSLTAHDYARRRIGPRFEHFVPIGSGKATPRRPQAPRIEDAEVRVGADYAPTAAITGLMPTIFSTRVKL